LERIAEEDHVTTREWKRRTIGEELNEAKVLQCEYIGRTHSILILENGISPVVELMQRVSGFG
jgi:hypothetical protein